MKKRNITICIIVGSLIVCFPIACFSGSLFYFWYNETQTGSFSGRVIDGVTAEPIEGAVVSYNWIFGGVLAESWAASYETVTDKEGKCKMVALVAAMRKLRYIMNTMLKKNQNWQPNFVKTA